MITLFSFLLLLSIIFLVIGMIKPKWIVIWRKKEQRKRKEVFIVFGLTTLCSSVLLLGFLINWLFFLLLLSILLIFVFLCLILVGVISPSRVYVKGERTRKRIVIQYGILLMISLALLIIAGSNIPTKEADERIFGAVYHGDISNGLKQGKGEVCNNSTCYDGEWQHDQRDGKGTETTNFGYFLRMKYIGHWKNDLENGQGKMIIHMLWLKTSYIGEFKDGKREGFGKFIDRSGNVYEGEWKNDAPNGKGKMILSNGETYVGEVENWKKQGQGKAVSKDGKILEGNWVNDQLEK